MSENDDDIWFPAKRYGWGWGFPITWQGWIVMAAFLALVTSGTAQAVEQARFPVILLLARLV